jgi:cytoskeletal protein RodZ
LGAFGEKLRKQREQRGIELDAISNTTKISTRMLRALEDEHFDQLPGGVFNKGFVRAYARHVGLDEQEAVSDYLAALRESQVQDQQILPNFRAPAANRDDSVVATAKTSAQVLEEKPRREPRPPQLSTMRAQTANPPVERFPKKYPAGAVFEPPVKPSVSIPWEKLAAALLLVALGLAFWSFRRHRRPDTELQPSASTQSAVPFSSPTSTPLPDHALSVEIPAAKDRAEATVQVATPPPTSAASLTTTPKTSSTPTPPASSPIASPNPPSTTPAPTKSAPANLPDEDATPVATSVPKRSAHPAAKPVLTFTLLIRATETSWVSITADGNPVAAETLIAPAGTSVRAAHEIVVRAGNAAGINFVLNGKPIPARGSEGEAKTYVFDSTGLRDLPPTP